MFKGEFLCKLEDCHELEGSIDFAYSKKFCGIITPLISKNNNKRDLLDENLAENQGCFTRSPLVLSANQWLNSIYPLIKINNDLDNKNESVRKNYEKKLIQEINYAMHVKSVGYYYIQATSCNPETLGKFLLSVLKADCTFVVEIATNNRENYSKILCKETENKEIEDTWTYWNKLHQSTNYSPQIEIALVLSSDMPEDNLEIYRWMGEPVSMVVIQHSLFLSNRSNFPVMPKKQQDLVKLFMQYQKCYIVIEPKSTRDHRIDSYLEFLKHQRHFVDPLEEAESFRYPLQPLYDNLDNSTYETFERDPAKYILYQRAVEAALKDFIPEEEIETRKLIILMVGVGRGPLIRCVLNASANTKRKVKILAVEKNPTAILTLSCLIRDLWPDKEIELIAKDMRNIDLEEKADIIISELLGSFGDNELSPECLDGVQHLLKPTGISIPCNSKSYIQPIMTKRIYNQIQKRAESEKKKRERHSEFTETTWLIYFTNVFHIDQKKEVFTFVHPNHDDPIDNTRHAELSFETPIDCILHGFLGYFSSELYKGIEISIVPETHTQGMASWYSIYFPIEKPIQLKKSDKIDVQFWRKLDATKVWYEWKVTSPDETMIHNVDGIIDPIFL